MTEDNVKSTEVSTETVDTSNVEQEKAEVKKETSALDPNTGLPAQTPDPFTDPAVAAKIAELNNQVSTLSKDAKAAKDIQKQLKEAQAKITEFENAQLSEAEKKEKEYQNALEEKAAAEKSKADVELENVRLKAFIGSGLKPEFLRFVQGATEEEVKESIADLQNLIAASIPQPTVQPAPQPIPSAAPVQQTAPITQPPVQQKHVFTEAEIAAMSPSEYAKNRDAILQAAARNEIK